MREHQTSEELMFSLGEGETGSFLEHRGLKLAEHLDNEAIERTFLLDENRALLGRIVGHFRFAAASPTGE